MNMELENSCIGYSWTAAARSIDNKCRAARENLTKVEMAGSLDEIIDRAASGDSQVIDYLNENRWMVRRIISVEMADGWQMSEEDAEMMLGDFACFNAYFDNHMEAAETMDELRDNLVEFIDELERVEGVQINKKRGKELERG